MASQSISIYRKNIDENKGDIYKLQNQFHIENCEEIIELNKNEILGYKKNIVIPESLNLVIYNNNNYQVKRRNKIMAEIKDSNNDIKRKK